MDSEELIKQILELSPRNENCCFEYCEDCRDYGVCKALSKVVKIIREAN